jgi:hypothetical protein
VVDGDERRIIRALLCRWARLSRCAPFPRGLDRFSSTPLWLTHRKSAWYRVAMGTSKIWSAEELEQMSPNERQSIVRAGFETDLSKVSPELLERTRRKIEAHIVANQDATTPER